MLEFLFHQNRGSWVTNQSKTVVDEVIDGPQSVVYQEAENRIHTAKAVMSLFIHDKLPSDRR